MLTSDPHGAARKLVLPLLRSITRESHFLFPKLTACPEHVDFSARCSSSLMPRPARVRP
jgi:hypothetical protein